MKICGQTSVELDATLENIEEILEYLKENLWTFRRKIGTFKRLKIDAGLEHLEEISLINLLSMLTTRLRSPDWPGQAQRRPTLYE